MDRHARNRWLFADKCVIGPAKRHLLLAVIAVLSFVVVLFLGEPGHAITFSWNTFYGGTGSVNYGYGMALDSSGNIYITGWSNSSWNGPNNAQPLNPYSNTNNLYVLKLGNDGAYKWHTFYGNGSSGDSIAVDGSGNVYVAGYSYATWNGPNNQMPLHSYGNIHILKLSSAGAYMWHTFYGNVEGNGITLDKAGNIYVAGYAYYSWYGPNGENPLNQHPGGSQDIFVLSLDSSGTYRWHTFYGAGSQSSVGTCITIDGGSNLYVSGYGGLSWKGPNGQAPLNPATINSQDIFVLSLDSSGTYRWHTFYGVDGGTSAGYSIAADNGGNAYVTGYANGGWNGPSGKLPLNAYSGISSFYALKLDSAGAYKWHTFYGQNNWGYGIAVSDRNQVYVTGLAYTTWNGPAGQTPLNGTNGIAVLGLDENGAYRWHTFYATRNNTLDTDTGHGIVIDGSWNIYLAGHGNENWGSPIHAFNGSQNIFGLKMTTVTCADHAVKIASESGDYTTIGAAYAKAKDGETILAQALSLSESPVFGRSVAVTLIGGYECGFSLSPGYTTINGTTTISGAPVTVENLVIK